MHNARGWTGAVVVPALTIAVLLLGARDGRAEDISGTVMRTVMLSENTRLVADVTCRVTGGPCIAFGAPNIVLALNGFTMTGQADPDTRGRRRRLTSASARMRRATSAFVDPEWCSDSWPTASCSWAPHAVGSRT